MADQAIRNDPEISAPDEVDRKGKGISKYIKKNREFIAEISKLTNADLAVLRRCNRNPLEDQRLFPILGRLGTLNSYTHSLIACLYAVYHKSEENPWFIEKYNFGRVFRNAYDPENKKQDTRFRAILTADGGDALAFTLRQAVRLIKSMDKPIDFSYLLGEMIAWESPKRWVQRKWAEGYYQGYSEPQEDIFPSNSENTDEDPEEVEV